MPRARIRSLASSFSLVWLEDAAGAQIPDTDSLQADACGPGYSYDSH